MSEKKWYAVYTKSRMEKQVAKEFEEMNIEHYLPLLKTLRQWTDRKKWVYVPLFNSYVFVKTNIKDREKILKADGAVNFVHFKDEYPSIPEYQINNLRIILGASAKFEIGYDNFTLGEKVNVTGGPFKGLKGTVIEYRGKQRLLVRIDVINQNLILEVNPVYIEKIV